MGSQNESKKNNDHGFSIFKNLFEIKRPAKGAQSSTLPRTKNQLDDDDNVSKNRLFIRHHSYRGSTRSSKYRKENVQKMSNEKYLVQSESRVKQICQQFELAQIKEDSTTHNQVGKSKTMYTRKNSDRKKQPTETGLKTSDSNGDTKLTESKDELIEKILANRERELNLLKQLHENIETTKRIYEKNSKKSRERKVQSFVEAENNEETEEFRQSVISEMDMEIAKMKEDGFIDENENVFSYSEDVLYANDTFLSQMHQNRKKSETSLSDEEADIEEQYTEEKHKKKESAIRDINEEAEDNMVELSDRFQDEFSESLGNNLENGLTIVEAYNDDGRELIEVQVMIDRKIVNLDNKQSIQDAMKESDMIFYQNEDKSFDLIQDRNKDIVKEENASSSNRGDTFEYINLDEAPFIVLEPPSKRSTIYSSTSQESSVLEDYDKDLEIRREKDQEELYQNVRRETFCDDKGIVRIERVAFSENTPFYEENIPSPISRSNSTTSSKKLEFIIDEIKSTEKKYVQDLFKVVKVYKPYLESNGPSSLKSYQGYLFGNIERIYRRQKRFLHAIERSADINDIIQCFIDNEELFELYPNYFRNKPKADMIIKEFSAIIRDMQENVEDRLDFSAYLLTPVQRLGKYILFLENIEKQLEKLNLSVENAQIALEIVRYEMSKGNDSVAIDSIEQSPVSKMDYGSFIMREKFNITKPRKVEAAMVFLFTNVIVFSTTDARNLELFRYYDHIKMNDLRIATFDDFTIHLTDFTKSKKKNNSSKYTYILESKTEKIWKTWKETIEKILWDQLLKVKENSLNNTALNRRRHKESRQRIKSTGSSVFYCE